MYVYHINSRDRRCSDVGEYWKGVAKGKEEGGKGKGGYTTSENMRALLHFLLDGE